MIIPMYHYFIMFLIAYGISFLAVPFTFDTKLFEETYARKARITYPFFIALFASFATYPYDGFLGEVFELMVKVTAINVMLYFFHKVILVDWIHKYGVICINLSLTVLAVQEMFRLVEQ